MPAMPVLDRVFEVMTLISGFATVLQVV